MSLVLSLLCSFYNYNFLNSFMYYAYSYCQSLFWNTQSKFSLVGVSLNSFPGVLLINIGLNSGMILYFVESISLTVKVTGHQWYWTYEYCDFENVVFDSYMLPEEEMMMGDFRLFEVNNRLVLPILVNIRLVPYPLMLFTLLLCLL